MPLIKRMGTEKIVLYDLEEASSLLGVCTRTLRSYAKNNTIPACRLRRKLYFTSDNITLFLKGAKSIRRKEDVKAPIYDDIYPPDPWEQN